MDFILSGLAQGFSLILRFDPEVCGVLWFTAAVAATATLVATLLGLPAGFAVASSAFRGRRFAIMALNTLMSLPTVVVGLIVYSLICRRGPLGSLGLLFTPSAIVIGEVVLTAPLIAALTLSAVESADPRIRLTARTLGAGKIRTSIAVLLEVRFAMMAAVLAGFGRAISEVGAAMMLGGNIRGYTRTLTTAIALDTGKGEFDSAMALGVVLLALALGFNVLLQILQGKARKSA